MRKITDDLGREWLVAVKTSTIVAVRAATSVDLLEAIQGPLLNRLWNDMALAVDVLFFCCADVAPANITREAWRDRWTGPTIEVATEILLEEIADFFPSARRAAIQKMIVSVKDFVTKAVEAVPGATAKELADNLSKLVLVSAGSSSGSSPAYSESIPETSPAGSST